MWTSVQKSISTRGPLRKGPGRARCRGCRTGWSSARRRWRNCATSSRRRSLLPGESGSSPRCCAAPFALRVSPQAAPTNSKPGAKPPGRLPPPDDGGPFAPRAPAAPGKRRARAAAGGLRSVTVRHEGSRGPIRATRSGAVTQPGGPRSARSHCCSPGRRVRPWLPQLMRAGLQRGGSGRGQESGARRGNRSLDGCPAAGGVSEG
jgi:hypothetical protein